MTHRLFCGLTFALLLASASAGDSTNRLHFPLAGFTIAPLDAPPGASSQSTLMMLLPVTDGFAPNVNVMIQPYPGTIADYVALTLEQFKTAGIKVVQQKSLSNSAVVFEYTGEAQGRALHWYARAEKSAASVYLVTATAASSQWNKEAARLKACVDSFRCEGGDPAAAVSPNQPHR